MTTQKWDSHAIKAELARRGYTLTGLALDNGLYASACRQGLMGGSRAGAELIAKVLKVPFRELFPDQYLRRPRKGTTKKSIQASPKRDDLTDRGAAA